MIKAIIGLGNPGKQYNFTRHNIGFRVVDALAEQEHSIWRDRDKAQIAEITTEVGRVHLIKPQTFMNSSGVVIPSLLKQGIKASEMLVVHDELELPFSKVTCRLGGSARGHNGLKSIIQACGPDFYRIRCGISRPQERTEVSDYVLQVFTEPASSVDELIEKAVALINAILSGKQTC